MKNMPFKKLLIVATITFLLLKKIMCIYYRKATEEFNKATCHLEAAQKEVKGFESKLRMVKETWKNKQSQVHVGEKRVRTINSEVNTLKAAIEKNDNR